MMKWLIRKRLSAFERRFGYDATYMRELLATDAGAFLRYARIAGLLKYRRDVPADVYHAASLTAIIAEDCGPCSQLGVAMALGEGVDPRMIAAVVGGNETDNEPARLGVRFARAVLAHDPAADELREAIARRWGPRAVVALAFAITAARVFPTMKYALGHGKACQRLDVAGELVVPRRARAAAMVQATA